MQLHTPTEPEPCVHFLVTDARPAARREPPSDLPPGMWTVCVDCGGPERCAGCPRPEEPNPFHIDNRDSEPDPRPGGRLNAYLRTILRREPST